MKKIIEEKKYCLCSVVIDFILFISLFISGVVGYFY